MSETYKGIIYLAIPYSHKSDEIRKHRERLVNKITIDKMNNGEIVYSPISYGISLSNEYDLPTDWSYWEKFCKSYISVCDELHVIMADGWENSKGVQNEIKFAKKLGKTIKYIEV